MKNSRIIVVIVNLTANIAVSSALASFINLDFEQANIPAIPPSTGVSVPISDGMPGWMGFIGTNQVSSVLHNGLTLGAASISILGPGDFTTDIIEGSYTAVLQSGANGLNLIDTSIAQIGLVPSSAIQLRFRSFGSTDLSVSFAGQIMPYAPIGSGANYILYACDVSPFAGEVGELRFSTVATPQNFNNPTALDSIVFSSVPEPSVLTLTAVACLLLGLYFWRSSRRNRPVSIRDRSNGLIQSE